MTAMTASPTRHSWVVTTSGTTTGGEAQPPPEPDIDVCCHRRLRGPYTGGGALVRVIVPTLLEDDAELVTRHATEIVSLAPELAPLVPASPRSLTELAPEDERTRFYPAGRTRRLAHGIAELVTEWARASRPGGVVIAFRRVDDADSTDHELLSVLLRRCDPALVTLLVEADGVPDGGLGEALAAHACRVARPADRWPEPPAGADLAQLYVDSDGTSRDPALLRAYDALPPEERTRRHSARGELLASLGDTSLRYGAIPYHLERGTDPAGAGVRALTAAVNECFAHGFYEAAMDFALRGRRVATAPEQAKAYWNYTHKTSACLSYVRQGRGALAYVDEIRRGSTDPELHMNCNYVTAMLYTRHLPREEHDEDAALAAVNTAIAIADGHPDPERRSFVQAFMRNGRALVELHRGDLAGAMALVNEAIGLTDEHLGSGRHLLHRSVLLYNRAQINAAAGEHAAALDDYDLLIRRDPGWGDYPFERAAVRRALGRYEEALADYAAAIELSLPFYEAHFNRANLLRDLGRDEEALRDLDRVLELEPDHVDSLVNRADLLLTLGQTDRARADIDLGLALDPVNVNLLCARGELQAERGDGEAARGSYSAALRADPEFAPAWANRAVLSYTEGRLTEAVEDLDHAIELRPADPELRANRGIALQDLGEHRRALEDLDAAVGAVDDPDLYYRRGASRYELGDVPGALADWRAHLAAYGPGESSPYAGRILARAPELAAGVPQGVV